ncbi:hypothetical protein GQX73_g918 [Xylaria multiplex]|uniref:DUF4430 domain-containing protein n=1 Tax=Xylaria multiplex TaxID=323545 RepID=A0A7C8NAW5_9PEZI|nr:hypothetical protein GQX73_g918 [Xylaria multiplex]
MVFIRLIIFAACVTATPAADNNPREHLSPTPSCGVSFTAHPAASTSGLVTCPSTVPAPSSNARLRIEGNDAEGTIFEACVVAGPREVTTQSGGTHKCDGTNARANHKPGTVPTVQLDAAAHHTGFSYDGTYDPAYEDYFITSISTSTQNSAQFWGILVNGQFTPAGGCQFEINGGDETLFAFDALSKDAFLKVMPDFAVAEAGNGNVTVTVTDSVTGGPQAGVQLGDVYTDVNGDATIPVPDEPGCYEFKGTRPGALRSNTFYLTVVGTFISA